MNTMLVADLMVPLSEYATVPEGSTLFDAVLALEKAQEEFDHTRYRHRGVLVLDKNNRVVGKLSHLDVLCALEPMDENDDEINELNQFGFSSTFIHNHRKQRHLKGTPLKEICSKANKLKVEDFMHVSTDVESIELEATLELAINQLVSGKHLSLLVTDGKEIVGILRLADVFAAIFHTMKECEISTG